VGEELNDSVFFHSRVIEEVVQPLFDEGGPARGAMVASLAEVSAKLGDGPAYNLESKYGNNFPVYAGDWTGLWSEVLA